MSLNPITFPRFSDLFLLFGLTLIGGVGIEVLLVLVEMTGFGLTTTVLLPRFERVPKIIFYFSLLKKNIRQRKPCNKIINNELCP